MLLCSGPPPVFDPPWLDTSVLQDAICYKLGSIPAGSLWLTISVAVLLLKASSSATSSTI